jgi:homoserine kinase
VQYVRVPGSSANLGAGFDALGLAVDLYAEVGLVDDGVPAGASAVDEHHPALKAFRRAGGRGGVWLRCNIPMGRGLGFSGAVRVGGLVAAHLQGSGADTLGEAKPALLDLAAELEGHPDNVAASMLGGLVVTAGGAAVQVPVAVQWELLAWVPSATTSTDKSRAVLGREVARADAVFNIGRTALLVGALTTGRADVLRVATEDRMHQMSRCALAPRSAEAMQTALDHGALASWLSGSGPTVLVACPPGESETIAASLPAGAQVKHLTIDTEGAHIVELDR